MRLIARTKLDNNEIAYMSDPQKLYEIKEKLYRYECVADEPEKVVATDRVLEIIEGFVESRFYPDGGADYYIEDVERLEDAIESLKGGDKK